MKPGIVTADPEIAPGDLVVIVEERHKKPLAIGRALVAGTEMKGEGKSGKVTPPRGGPYLEGSGGLRQRSPEQTHVTLELGR